MRGKKSNKKVDERWQMLRLIKKSQFVLLVTEGGNERISTTEAISRAEAAGLDLILLSNHREEPVVTIKDFNRYNYEKKKKKTIKKTSKQREMTMTACIGDNDLAVKLKKIGDMLNGQNPVRIVISTRFTRKHRHKGLTIDGLKQIALDLVEKIKSQEIGTCGPVNEDRMRISFIITPAKKVAKKQKKD
jgi:translation initiation factor IF-3